MDFMVNIQQYGNFFHVVYKFIDCYIILSVADECQNKYGNANAWKYCCRVFDLLTVAAVSIKSI